MATSKELPIIVIFHGAWHTPWHYSLLADELRNHGFEVHSPALPTHNGAKPANTTLESDTIFAGQYVGSVLEANPKRNIMICGHSYGGVVTSGAAVQDMTVTARRAKGLEGGVSHLFYIAAFILLEGDSLAPNGTPADEGKPIFDVDPDNMTCTPPWPMHYFYHDIEPKLAEECINRTIPISVVAFTGVLEYSSVRDVPSITYLLCNQDRTIRPEGQKKMVEKITGAGIRVREEILETGHSPFLTMPKETAEIILKAAQVEV